MSLGQWLGSKTFNKLPVHSVCNVVNLPFKLGQKLGFKIGNKIKPRQIRVLSMFSIIDEFYFDANDRKFRKNYQGIV